MHDNKKIQDKHENTKPDEHTRVLLDRQEKDMGACRWIRFGIPRQILKLWYTIVFTVHFPHAMVTDDTL